MPVIVVEDDKILRLLEVILDPRVTQSRVEAFKDYLSFDVADPLKWFTQQRRLAAAIYPAEVILVKNPMEMRSALPDADAIVIENLKVSDYELSLGKKLRLVQKFGVDTRNIDLTACAKMGIRCKTLRRRVNGAVGEHAILLMLALGRKLIETNGALDFGSLRSLGYRPALFKNRHVQGANWARVNGIQSLQGATVGALGLGEIGREVAVRAKAMGSRILYYQRRPLTKKLEKQSSATFVSFEKLLQTSDFISIHLPLNPETKGMLNQDAFALMKKNVILSNVSRAPIIDRDALIEALDNKNIGGVGLDVHYQEPSAKQEPLKQYANVILSPHIAVAHRSHNLADMAELIKNLFGVLGS
tara:strand:+ start:1067 stop:2143 length:1077 start_codon:yes stop_codon:yes gene_type:complete